MKKSALLLLLLSFASFAQKIPKNSHKVKNLWGWECDKGYIQQRDKCEKVKLPKNGYLNEDGHTWSCREGFEKYRDVCKKIKK
jgi:hypothetical protein